MQLAVDQSGNVEASFDDWEDVVSPGVGLIDLELVQDQGVLTAYALDDAGNVWASSVETSPATWIALRTSSAMPHFAAIAAVSIQDEAQLFGLDSSGTAFEYNEVSSSWKPF
jgi:hypothetical protein